MTIGDEEAIVSEVVLAVLDASTTAISAHFQQAFGSSISFEHSAEISRRLWTGEEFDLHDLGASAGEASLSNGFQHYTISRIFHRRLKPVIHEKRSGGQGKGKADHHIWSRDDDRHQKSILPTGSAETTYRSRNPPKGRVLGQLEYRTRPSSIVQQALYGNRHVLQTHKATTAKRGVGEPFDLMIPSPFFVGRMILTDPETPASDVYADAAIRTEIIRYLAPQFESLQLSHQSISDALEIISGRLSTSKPVKANADRRRGDTLFICHYLAAKGILSLQIEIDQAGWEDFVETGLFKNVKNIFDMSKTGAKNSGLGNSIAFRLNPNVQKLPDAGELLNELQGLPIPIEGANSIFHGGLRFASEGNIVMALSGSHGAGKTSTCLSFAASMAPLGCKTLFLTCEEEPADVESRLREAIPSYVRKTTPPFRCVPLDVVQSGAKLEKWFTAHKIRNRPLNLEPTSDDSIQEEAAASKKVAGDVKTIIGNALDSSTVFEQFRDATETANFPPFSRPIVIIDGFHQLFNETDGVSAQREQSLRRLIDYCRTKKAVFLFTVAQDEAGMDRMNYLCDFVIELTRTGVDKPSEPTKRIFKLLKARRQPAYIGAHLFHITGRKSFRIKLNVASYAERSKVQRWIEPDNKKYIFIDRGSNLKIQARSQILVFGKGSSGKSGLGLYILNHRPVAPEQVLSEEGEPNLFSNGSNHDQEMDADKHHEKAFPFFEARTLVVSFLYQAHYYRELEGRRQRSSRFQKGTEAPRYDFPDRTQLEVTSLYPGDLSPENFLAKIENTLSAAELRGIPFTGVMIDGIHNVYVQFPALQNDISFWPQLYGLLRRRGLMTVTTHTDFDMMKTQPFGTDFEHAQLKAAPLLSVLVSSADYSFELSTVANAIGRSEYRLAARATLGQEPPSGFGLWDRDRLKLGGWQN